MDNRTQSRGGRIGGRHFPRLALAAAGAPVLLWVLATYGALKPQTVEIHNHAPAVPVGPSLGVPEIKIPAPRIYVQNSEPETMEAVAKELQARQSMLQAAQDEITAEATGLVRYTRMGNRLKVESPPLYFSDCVDDPILRQQRPDGSWDEGGAFASGV